MSSINLTATKALAGKAGVTDSLFQTKFQQSKYHRTNVKFTLGLPLFKYWAFGYGFSKASMQLCLTRKYHCWKRHISVLYLLWHRWQQTVLSSSSVKQTWTWGVPAVNTQLSTSATPTLTPGWPGWTWRKTSNHPAASWGCLSSAGRGSTSPAMTD